MFNDFPWPVYTTGLLVFVFLVGNELLAHGQEVEALQKGVVKIIAEVEGRYRVGSGFIVGLDGKAAYVVTASHVVEGDRSPKVSFFSKPGLRFESRVLGIDGANPKGLAALMVEGSLPSGLRVLTLERSLTVNGLEVVTIIGFPLAIDVPWALLLGNVVGRRGPDLVFSGIADAGNSGGPVLHGTKVIGLVIEAGNGFGIAVPSPTVRFTLEGWSVPFDTVLETGNRDDGGVGDAIEIPKKTTAVPEAMTFIPAGTFQMGSSHGEGEKDELPRRSVTLGAFYLDTYEVTNQEFRKFVRTRDYQTTAEIEGKAYSYTDQGSLKEISGASWRQPEGEESVFVSGRERHPVVSISWDDAHAYCAGVGKRLPTEAEWEYAARAGTQTAYWWGNTPPDASNRVGNLADRSAKESLGLRWALDGYNDGFVRTAPVGSFEANPWGLYDMAGNVWEWVADWYSEDYYKQSPRESPNRPENGTAKVLRGGSWTDHPMYLRAAFRFKLSPTSRYSNNGVRCAKDVDKQ